MPSLGDRCRERRSLRPFDADGAGPEQRQRLGDDEGLAVEGDRQILAAALANVLQNAVKFTRPQGRVSLNTYATADRILIWVEDQCGGLPEGKTEELFRPFEQAGADRTGLGLGLPISRRGVEANGGHLYVRNIPGTGCVFTIDLPRAI